MLSLEGNSWFLLCMGDLGGKRTRNSSNAAFLLCLPGLAQQVSPGLPTATETSQRGLTPAVLPGLAFPIAVVLGTYGCIRLETQQAHPQHDVGGEECTAVMGTLPLTAFEQGSCGRWHRLNTNNRLIPGACLLEPET